MALVGRERELAALAEALQRASEGQPARLVLSGRLGIGLTALLDELGQRLAELPEVVLCRARCHAPRMGVAYGPLAEALEARLGELDDDRLVAVVGPSGWDLAELTPGIAERLAAAGAPVEPPKLEAGEQRGARMHESLLGVLERLAGDGVVCLVIDDAEHADPATRGFIDALLRLGRPMRLALILACHPTELSRRDAGWRFVESISRSDAVTHIEVGPLHRDELLQMVEAIAGERPTLGVAAALLEGSAGIPLLALQLFAARQVLDGVRLSDPLDEIVHARLVGLDEGIVQVLRALAIAGRPVADEEMLALRSARGHLNRQLLGRALETGLARREGNRLAIVHPLIGEAIGELSLPAERRALHAALAEQLAARPTAEPAEAAWHWARARRPVDAQRAHLAAAAAAALVDPGSTALLHYQRALELGELDADTLAAAAGAAGAAGSFRRAVVLAEQAISHRTGGRLERFVSARRQPAERVVVGELLEALGRYRRGRGDAAGARTAFESAVATLPDEPSAARARALAALAQDLMLEGRFEDSAGLAEQARAVAEAVGQPALAEYGHATCTLGVDVAYMGQLARGLELLETATNSSRRAGRLDDVIRAYANRTTLLDLDTRREEALAVVKDGIAEASASGLGLTYGAFLRGNAADILFQLGRWQEAEEECRAALEFPPAGVAWFSPLLYLSLVLVESRADDEAARLVGRTLLQLESVPAGQWSALVQRAAVSLALWRGDMADARRAAANGWRQVLETDDASQIAASAATVLEVCSASAEAARLRRDWAALAEAGELAEQVIGPAERRLAQHELPPTLGARREAQLQLETARAHEARLRGRDKPALWAGLADAWSAANVPYQAAKCHWWRAAAALHAAAAGERPMRREARRALHAALEIANRLPARPLRRALLDLAARGRLTLPEGEDIGVPVMAPRPAQPVLVARPPAGVAIAERLAEPAPPSVTRFGLSPRENAVLEILTEGRTNREIAERLFISERTVAVHVRRILAKLGVSGRVEAAGLAIRLDLENREQ